MAIIYKIENKINNKVYIGQTKSSLDTRLTHHLWGHFTRAFEFMCTSYLCTALRKYGKDAFTYEIIEEVNINSYDRQYAQQILDEREIHWIAHYNSTQKEFGYNQTPGGQGAAKSVSIETKRKISECTKKAMAEKQIGAIISSKRKGVKLSAEHIYNRTLAQTGAKRSEETKLKISKAGKGRKVSEQARANIKAAAIKRSKNKTWRDNVSKGVLQYYKNKNK